MLSENLLDTFEKARLIDPYDIYQHLMDYWEATMQDDVYQIVGDGWEESAKLKLIVEERGTRSREKANLIVGRKKYKAELIPPELMIARYFAADQAKIEQLEADAAAVGQSMEELAEEHSGEEGLLEEAKTDTGKLTKVSVNALRDIKGDKEADEEHKVLCEYLDLIRKESELTRSRRKLRKPC
ncbi:MAG: hypothetical protein U0936_13675 [Planctomycetaceae bacterium]